MGEQAAIVDWDGFARTRSELGPAFVRVLGYFREDGEKAVSRIEAGMHARDAGAMITPAQTLKSEARQFGADPLCDLAEEIEFAARDALEMRSFPDEVLPAVARLRPLYEETMALFEREANPLAQRRSADRTAAGNQAFGRI